MKTNDIPLKSPIKLQQEIQKKILKGGKTLTLRWSQNPRDLTYMDEILISIAQST